MCNSEKCDEDAFQLVYAVSLRYLPEIIQSSIEISNQIIQGNEENRYWQLEAEKIMPAGGKLVNL